MEVGGQRHVPALYLLYRKLGGRHGRSGRVWKISPTPRFSPRTDPHVNSRYTDSAARKEFTQEVISGVVFYLRKLYKTKSAPFHLIFPRLFTDIFRH